MRGGAIHNLEHKNIFCPILLKEMLNALKQRNLMLHRQIRYFIYTQEENTTVKNVFTLKSKDIPNVEFKLKTY